MKSWFFLCIDETDELGGEISTGSLAEDIASYIGYQANASKVPNLASRLPLKTRSQT